MRKRRSQFSLASSAFTLLELIMVMMILAIAAALIVPSLRQFGISRASDSAAMQVQTLAQYARTQAVGMGKTYRLNFDTQKNQVWLTLLDPDTGTYAAPPNDFGNVYTLPSGMRMTVDVTMQPNTLLLLPVSVAQNTVDATVPYGKSVAPQTNQVITVAHDEGTYVEFQSSGRSDPVLVTLTDQAGNVIELGCQTATETLHVLSATEAK